MKLTFRHTKLACYTAMATQAIVVTIAPLLFIIFKENYHLTDEQLGRLILFNFGTQIFADILATNYCDRLGYRASAMLAHIFCALGLISIAVLPMLLPSEYTALLISCVIYAFGGGIIEVVTSPIIDSIPSENGASSMSLAHSFFCWGQMTVVAFTTVAIQLIGRSVWYIIPIVWSIIPIFNVLFYSRVPMMPTVPEEKRTPKKLLFKNPACVIGMLMMIAAGSSEITMSQWASLFVEESLHVSKMVGDLLGPCLFAFTMALMRVYFGFFGDRIHLEKALMLSALACIVCYLLAVFIPALTLVGCALCGATVALMWPGTLSNGSRRFPLAGTALFGIYAICGDIGCSFGPWLAGVISDTVNAGAHFAAIGSFFGWADGSHGLRIGLLAGTFFPIMMFVCAFILYKKGDRLSKIKN